MSEDETYIALSTKYEKEYERLDEEQFESFGEYVRLCKEGVV